MLGKIYEEKGWKGKAIEHNEKFLDLWRNADPGIAEVEDARKRLAGLQQPLDTNSCILSRDTEVNLIPVKNVLNIKEL